MNYEIAVLAALVQTDEPTKPAIAEKTGISTRRVDTAIKHLKELLGVDIVWTGPRKTGHYSIQSWGAFGEGKLMLKRALALNLGKYKKDKTIEFNASMLKANYSKYIKGINYKHSLRLEGFSGSLSNTARSMSSPRNYEQAKADLINKYKVPASQ